MIEEDVGDLEAVYLKSSIEEWMGGEGDGRGDVFARTRGSSCEVVVATVGTVRAGQTLEISCFGVDFCRARLTFSFYYFLYGLVMESVCFDNELS